MKLQLYYSTLLILIIKCSGNEDNVIYAEDNLKEVAGEIIHASVVSSVTACN